MPHHKIHPPNLKSLWSTSQLRLPNQIFVMAKPLSGWILAERTKRPRLSSFMAESRAFGQSLYRIQRWLTVSVQTTITPVTALLCKYTTVNSEFTPISYRVTWVIQWTGTIWCKSGMMSWKKERTWPLTCQMKRWHGKRNHSTRPKRKKKKILTSSHCQVKPRRMVPQRTPSSMQDSIEFLVVVSTTDQGFARCE